MLDCIKELSSLASSADANSFAIFVAFCYNKVTTNNVGEIGKQSDKLNGIRLAKNNKVKSRWNSGICSLCGKWCEMITQEHAKEHGFKDAGEMAKAGVIK